MSAIDVIDKLSNNALAFANLKFCLVDNNKRPFKINNMPAKINNIEDFVDLEELFQCTNLQSYAGIGISIQASNVCAIDVDNCFSRPNDISSADERALYFIEKFKHFAYCEFSFSGTGLRILFRQAIIENYSDKFYIKNESNHIEYYQPTKSYRYVTLTGNTIFDNNVDSNVDFTDLILDFLNKFMLRPTSTKSYAITTTENETRSYEELMNIVKGHYLRNITFQNLWFNAAPGSGKDESERDYHLVAFLYENVTQNKDLLKQIFESSNFFKTKDFKHIQKWNAQNFRYFNYLYDRIRRTK